MLMPQKTKVLLVDDHPLVREWLAHLLNQQADFQVCGEATNGPQAIKLMASAKPDVAIVDVSLAGGSGIELIKSIKADHPDVVMVVLSMHDESLYAERVLRAGARGYVMKREATKKIIPAIRHVLEGKLFVSEKFLAAMAERLVEWNAAGGSPVGQLSEREMEVFQMIGQGMETRQIAEAMHVSFKTIQSFSARIKEKLMLANATELVREAVLWHAANDGNGGKTREARSR
jgi:DNA-binding NarL/FixJ family response regulator